MSCVTWETWETGSPGVIWLAAAISSEMLGDYNKNDQKNERDRKNGVSIFVRFAQIGQVGQKCQVDNN